MTVFFNLRVFIKWQPLLILPKKTQNLPMPIVRHQRNAYKVFKDKSIYYMQQIEVDFR